MHNALWRIEKAHFPFPAAIVYHGSVRQRLVWGLTRRHAAKRALRTVALPQGDT